MNDFKNQLYPHNYPPGNITKKYQLLNEMLNRLPMGGLKYDRPIDRMKKMLEEIGKEE